MHIETRLAQAGSRREDRTGAISFPVYHSAVYRHPGVGKSTGYDYSRTGNPTRTVLEETLADLEGGAAGFAFSSGMAAIAAVGTLFKPGDHLIVSADLYGGTYRLLEELFGEKYGLRTDYVDTTDASEVDHSVQPSTRAILVETPTNPLMRITDLAEIVATARERNLQVIVDNTLMTPYLQRPLELGADIVVHSATKFLGGHNDVLAGAVVCADEITAEKIGFVQNAAGAVLGPQDSWLVLRGMKTLALRMKRHAESSLRIAQFLLGHDLVTDVYYPGLPTHPGFAIQQRQASGAGGLLSFRLMDADLVEPLLEHIEVISYAESLGGTESLMTFPSIQTHADIPEEMRRAAGVDDTLLRLSVGLEDSDELIEDLNQALKAVKP